MKHLILCLLVINFFSCGQEQLYLSGHIGRAYDAVMTTCDPYNRESLHTCIIFSSALQNSLYIYDATTQAMVWAPNKYSPLKVPVGPITDNLIIVKSDDKKFPLMLALDHQESALYPVRLFPSADKKLESFQKPKSVKLLKAPFKMAAAEIANKIIAIGTFPQESRIELMALEKETGQIDSTVAKKSISLGLSPNWVVIDFVTKSVVISDLQKDEIHVLDLNNLFEFLTKDVTPLISSINIGMPSDQLYLSRRDVGNGMHLYGAVFKASGREVRLINIDQKKLEKKANMMLDSDMTAAYFPDLNNNTCCGDCKNWFSIAFLNGTLSYISINKSNDALLLKKAASIDLTKESNLALSKVHIIKILGGYIEPDPNVKKESVCRNNRQTFYITSFANSRSYLNIEPLEVEGHSYSCEGESSASRFGFRRE